MRRRIIETLVTWPFLLSVFVLLVNDWWLKAAYPGVVSGKLSDFSGIAVVALLLLAAFPAEPRIVCAVVGATFLWWKSPASTWVIDLVNSVIPVQIGRVVDYGDLAALLVLPLCVRVVANPSRFALGPRTARRILAAPIALAAFFAVMGTSVIPTRHEYTVRPTEHSQQLEREAVADGVHQVALKHRMQCGNCSRPLEAAAFEGNGMQMAYTFTTDKAVVFSIVAYPTGLFFGSGREQRAEALRRELKAMFAARFEGLEYVEQLTPR